VGISLLDREKVLQTKTFCVFGYICNIEIISCVQHTHHKGIATFAQISASIRDSLRIQIKISFNTLSCWLCSTLPQGLMYLSIFPAYLFLSLVLKPGLLGCSRYEYFNGSIFCCCGLLQLEPATSVSCDRF